MAMLWLLALFLLLDWVKRSLSVGQISLQGTMLDQDSNTVCICLSLTSVHTHPWNMMKTLTKAGHEDLDI